jgi:hypothetical protein
MVETSWWPSVVSVPPFTPEAPDGCPSYPRPENEQSEYAWFNAASYIDSLSRELDIPASNQYFRIRPREEDQDS